jgi:hypothetical protein
LQSALIKFFGILKLLTPALYIVGAILLLLSFVKSKPDGLGNIWLTLYTFPIVIIGTFILHQQFQYVSGSYYKAHALCFCPSVAFLALVLFFSWFATNFPFAPRP